MHRSQSAFLLCGLLIASGAAPAVSQDLCKPALFPKASEHSEVVNFQRKWTGTFAVDASRCATKTGFFEVEFVRLKEIGPDLPFTELFTWSPGQMDVTLDLAWDEWVSAYKVGQVHPCPCR
jgi:hypothetical protein